MTRLGSLLDSIAHGASLANESAAAALDQGEDVLRSCAGFAASFGHPAVCRCSATAKRCVMAQRSPPKNSLERTLVWVA